MPQTVKTAVSLSESLFNAGETLARELKVSRSRLFAMALEDFLRRRENQRLLAEINAAYEDELDEEETALLEQMRKQHARLVKREE